MMEMAMAYLRRSAFGHWPEKDIEISSIDKIVTAKR